MIHRYMPLSYHSSSFLCVGLIVVPHPDTLLLLWIPWRLTHPQNCCCNDQHCPGLIPYLTVTVWAFCIPSTHVQEFLCIRSWAQEMTRTDHLNYETAKQTVIWAQIMNPSQMYLTFTLCIGRVHMTRPLIYTNLCRSCDSAPMTRKYLVSYQNTRKSQGKKEMKKGNEAFR